MESYSRVQNIFFDVPLVHVVALSSVVLSILVEKWDSAQMMERIVADLDIEDCGDCTNVD